MKGLLIIILGLFSKNIFTESTKKNAKTLSDKAEVQTIKNRNFNYSYSLKSKPNPFIPPVIEAFSPRIEIEVVAELQKFTLSQLKLVGTWGIKDKKSACLILTPEGKSITSEVGDPIGRKGGVISRIYTDYIEIKYKKILKTGEIQDAFETLHIKKKEDLKEEKIEKIILTPSSAQKETKKLDKTPQITL